MSFREIKLTSEQTNSTDLKSAGSARAFDLINSTLPEFIKSFGKAQSATSTAYINEAPRLNKQSEKPPLEHPISAQVLPFTFKPNLENASSSLYAP